MYRIAIIGGTDNDSTTKVKEFLFKVKKAFGDTATIFSGGNPTGIEYDVKKYALEFGLPYKEFNPSFTGHNVYSFLPMEYFGKGRHPSHYPHRYQEMLIRTDRLLIGSIESDQDWKLYDTVRKQAEKKNIPVVFI